MTDFSLKYKTLTNRRSSVTIGDIRIKCSEIHGCQILAYRERDGQLLPQGILVSLPHDQRIRVRFPREIRRTTIPLDKKFSIILGIPNEKHTWNADDKVILEFYRS